MTDPLAILLSLEAYRVFLVFVRAGAAVMFLPGFGEMTVPMRIRLGAAAVLALALAQAVPGLPAAVPAEGGELVRQIAGELVAGSFLGLGARLFLSALQVTGSVIGQAAGLSNPFAVAGTGFEGGSVISGTLVIAGIAVIFAADLHYLMLGALLRSYGPMPVAAGLDTGALAQDFSVLVAATFRLGVGLAAPFLAFAMLFNVALGLVNRAMPALPVFFVGTPALVVGGLLVLAVTSAAMLSAFSAALADWLGGW
ncbi:flagellar biosynthetic protein FliR [Arenibaculum sp.]|uniref:flagellar biosynthetic protein FliR n=1 Tax=Arenibaculum sp. TaxID=2865862 RepID=UPI002E11D68F|nr:flagellar biosynthetic protein FliR [Arenibaculum sp.]